MKAKPAHGGPEGLHRIELTYDDGQLDLVSGKVGEVTDIRYALGHTLDGNNFFQDQQRTYYRSRVVGLNEDGSPEEFGGNLTVTLDPFRDQQGNARPDQANAARELVEDVQAMIKGGYIVGKAAQQSSLGAAYKAISDRGIDIPSLQPEGTTLTPEAVRETLERYDEIKEARRTGNNIKVEQEDGYLRLQFSRHNYAHFIDGLAIEKDRDTGRFTVNMDLYPYDKQDLEGNRLEFFHGVTNLHPSELISAYLINKRTDIPAEKIKYGAAKQGRPLDPESPQKTVSGEGKWGRQTKPQPTIILQDLTAEELNRVVDKLLFQPAIKGIITPMSAHGPGVENLREFMDKEVNRPHASKDGAQKQRPLDYLKSLLQRGKRDAVESPKRSGMGR